MATTTISSMRVKPPRGLIRSREGLERGLIKLESKAERGTGRKGRQGNGAVPLASDLFSHPALRKGQESFHLLLRIATGLPHTIRSGLTTRSNSSPLISPSTRAASLRLSR